MKRVLNLMLVIALILTSVSTAFVYAADETVRVSAISMEGLLNVGQTLELTYTCDDCEGLRKSGALEGAEYRWYTSGGAQSEEFTLIDGANAYNYTLTEAELGKFIKAELIAQGETFSAFSSAAVGEKGANLALGKGCEELSTKTGMDALKLEKAFDGDKNTRFAAEDYHYNVEGRFVTADFGTKATYNKVCLTLFRNTYGKITLEASDDGKNWTLIDVYNDKSAYDPNTYVAYAVMKFPDTTSRYLRTEYSEYKEGGIDGIQLNEFEVFNADKNDSDNLALGKASIALSHYGYSNMEADRATDGDYSRESRFAPNTFNDNKYFTVDFGDFEAFNTIATYFFAGQDYTYDVMVSNDANKWKTVAENRSVHSGSDGDAKGEAEVIAFNTVTARYLRLDFTNHTGITPSIIEFEAYNRPNEEKELTAKDSNIAIGKKAYFNRCFHSADNTAMIDKIQSICDGDKNTCLSFYETGNAYVVYDLFDIYKINKAVITEKSGEKKLSDYTVETSLDGITWNKVFTGSKKGVNSAIARFRDASARFVRIEFIDDSNGGNVSEIELYYEDNNGNLAYGAADPSRSTIIKTDDPLYLPERATDGMYGTLWDGRDADTPLFTLNFGTAVDFNTLVVSEVERGGLYAVEYSSDGTNWVTMEGLTGSNIDNTEYKGGIGRVSIFAFDTINAQFLRLRYTYEDKSQLIQLREIEVYNRPNETASEISGSNLALGKNVYLHDGREDNFKNITDGNADTYGTVKARWDGAKPYVLIDLENKTAFNRIKLAGDKNITKVETSDDGIAWKTVSAVLANDLSFAKETARFVKISVENDINKIYEIEISLAEKYAVKSVDIADGRLNAINIEKGRDAAEYEGENLKTVIGVYNSDGMLINAAAANTADIADGKLTLSNPIAVTSGQKVKVFIFNSLDSLTPAAGKFETTVE